MKLVESIKSSVNGILDRAVELINKAPTTNLRILLTLGITLGTAIKYWTSSTWIPDWQWLIFLAGMAGLDVWQHHNKRKTSWSPKEHAEAAAIQNGHTTDNTLREEGDGLG